MERRLSNIFKTTNVMNLTKVILESSYRVLKIICEWKALKLSVYFLKAVECCPIFHIQIERTLSIFCEKQQNFLESTLFRKPTEVSQNTPTFISIESHITK